MSPTTTSSILCTVTTTPLNMSYPPTLMHPNSRPLRHKPSAASSLWALDAEDYERLAKELELIPPPPRIHLPFRRSHTLFHQPYNIGDPFFVEDSLEPYIFQGFTGKVSYGPRGDMMQEAAFRPSYGMSSDDDVFIRLHSTSTLTRIQSPRYVSLWSRLRDRVQVVVECLACRYDLP
jgi:hypothetical protein